MARGHYDACESAAAWKDTRIPVERIGADNAVKLGPAQPLSALVAVAGIESGRCSHPLPSEIPPGCSSVVSTSTPSKMLSSCSINSSSATVREISRLDMTSISTFVW